MSEELLVTFSAPTLAGIKTGSMFTCEYQGRSRLLQELRDMNRRLSRFGVYIIPLRCSEKRALLYLFRPQKLEQDLQSPEVRVLLRQQGYPAESWTLCVRELIRRLGARADFPHEVGLFLGYPAEDVRGFIEHRGQGSKYTGPWKVYGNLDAALERFDAFRRCTASFCSRLQNGTALEQLASDAMLPAC